MLAMLTGLELRLPRGWQPLVGLLVLAMLVGLELRVLPPLVVPRLRLPLGLRQEDPVLVPVLV